ncbi:hypothetical protein LTR10_020348 [Elasticomyces elasticus]|uniref:DNA damage-responsive protein 48 n=1 Tax=Exophiala sideris TaxID=1016849 RepID=A0ABR0J9P1_9EURO|nr:hypothetical protein LTR10_020348 [Elasticomyces elasticus]KAK5022812.1 hypothetical protein LTS07_009790 [Exophiala sideris]KAK5026714.1 hypothetical protein LTR13_009938 [Exophiala sideris]KAK5059439.1 hypothetical protein LTR69_006028 [Exophiala sideris]KAK5177417.1 hypothetical protein LTR44_010032 [Eurotiomycetes sp. CCFEE 6388]
MDRLRGAINSFKSGNEQQSGQATTSGAGNDLDPLDNNQYLQQTGQGTIPSGHHLGTPSNSGYPLQTDQGTHVGGLDNNGHTAQQTAQGTSGSGGSFLGRLSNNDQNLQQTGQGTSAGGGNFLGGLGNKFNAAAGGGPQSEKNEDMLDKAVDYVQEKFLGQGPQNNESAMEQMKDEQISDFIRAKYKSTTGSDFPIKDKSR